MQGRCPLPPRLSPAVWLPPWLQIGWNPVDMGDGCLGWRFLGCGFGFWAEGCSRVGVHGLHNAPKWVATVCGCSAPLLGVMAPNKDVNGAPRGFCVMAVSSSFPCWACTLSGWLPPNHTLIFPGAQVCGHLRGFVPHRTLVLWEGKTVAILDAEALFVAMFASFCWV